MTAYSISNKVKNKCFKNSRQVSENVLEIRDQKLKLEKSLGGSKVNLK